MHNTKKYWFTLIELIITVSVIWILIAWMTIYLWWSNEKRKIIEAQWCASAIWWEINNFLFHALTSKSIKVSDSTPAITPDYYIIKLAWWNSDSNLSYNGSNYNNCTTDNYKNWNDKFCSDFVLSYAIENQNTITTYKTINSSNTCKQYDSNLKYIRDDNDKWEIAYININKWFSPVRNEDQRVFYLQRTDNKKILLWNVLAILCLDDECLRKKEIWKRVVDGRSQTISLKKCKFYNDDNSTCKTREGCTIYNSADPTVCDEY